MSQSNLTEDLNIVANSNLEITYMDGDLNIIQALDDEPNDVGGLTSAELKAKFDEGPNKIKEYINGTLIPEILTEEATEAARAAAEAQREANEKQRIENENARIAAEQDRVSETTGIVAQATEQAEAAEESARQAAQAILGQIVDGSLTEEKLAAEVQAAINRAKAGGEIDTLLAGKAPILKSNLTIYVSTTGSDTTGDGSSGKPFRTIQHAIDIVPPVLNGKYVSINVAAGTYDEDVVITGKCASRGYRPIFINGASSKEEAVNYKVRSVYIVGTGMACVNIKGFNFTGHSNGRFEFYSYGDSCAYLSYCVLDSTVEYGIFAGDRPYSHLCIIDSTISNKTKSAIAAEFGNVVQVHKCDGTNNAVVFKSGFEQGFGGMIFDCGANTISGTVAEVKNYGGQIFK